jgi:di/tricarboxylate transporter
MNLFSMANIYFLFELFALLLCMIYYKRIQGSSIKLLPLFMLSIVLFDLIAYYRRFQGLDNGWINDLVIPFEMCYLMLMGRSFLTKPGLRSFAWVCVLAYLIFFGIDEIFYRDTYARLYLRSYLAGVIGLLVVVIMYGYELLGSDRLFRFYKEPAFWVCAGALLFYLGTLPFHLAWNVASVKFFKAYSNTRGIFYLLMCVMYTFFSVSILCLKPKTR